MPASSQMVSVSLDRDMARRIEPISAGPVESSLGRPPIAAADPLAQTRQQVYELQKLPAGWDGADAVQPTPASVRLALHWLTSCYAACRDAGLPWYAPSVAADVEGEVVLEWWGQSRSLIISVNEDGVRSHRSEDVPGGPTRHTHGDAAGTGQQTSLLRWLNGD